MPASSDPAFAHNHDPREREADAVAGHVAAERSSAATPRFSFSRPTPSHARPLAESTGIAPAAASESVHRVLLSPGQPLDSRTLAFFESRFGRDLSETRVHTGAEASRSAEELNALAYTAGRDIIFGRGSFAPGTPSGDRLLAHELTHVVQQSESGPAIQCQGPPHTANPPPSTQKLPEYKPADSVEHLARIGSTDDWEIYLRGFTSEESGARAVFPKHVPPGVIFHFNVAELEPQELGLFTISGLTYDKLEYVDPSIAQLFKDHGLEDENKANPALEKARAAFRERHEDHGEWVLNAMDVALKRAAKRNPDLLISYYNYYASHKLADPGRILDRLDKDKEAGKTSSGDTIINPRVLRLEPSFPTDDPLSLLGSTLIHEYVHTPQGPASDPVSSAPKEAKAYGVELFFAERMGDKKRADIIEKKYSQKDSVDVSLGTDKIFYKTYRVISELYKIIDQGGPQAENARKMSVEFISQNESDYSQDLVKFIAGLSH